MVFRWIIFLSTLLFTGSLLGQTLTSSVDRNQLTENQTLTLTVTYDERVRSDALDLSGILQDFDVIRSSSGSFTQLINGQSSVSTNWELVLLPKRSGRLVVPSFSLGNIYSQAVQIQVLEAGQVTDSNEPMTVELNLDRNEARVGEQVLATVRLRVQNHITDLGGEALQVEGAEVQNVNQKEFSEIVNGISWRVMEWTYALFPQDNGSIAIPRQMFFGVVPSTQPRSFFESLSSRGQRISSRSDPASLNVLPALNDNSDWFAASDVSISSSWTSDPSNLRVGEPLTRIVEVAAKSQLAAAIPPLESPVGDNYKAYEDQPSLSNTTDTTGVTGIRVESTAIVPSEKGTIEFPEQIIRWWNINTEQWQEAVLPAETYQVLPAAISETFSPPTNFESPSVVNLDTSSFQGADTILSGGDQTEWYWKWATIALLVVVFLQTAYLLSMQRQQPINQPSKNTQPPHSESEKSAWNELVLALKSQDAARIRQSILSWSRVRWPEDSIHTLDSVAEKSGSDKLSKALTQLELILFKGASGKLEPKPLFSELKRLREQASTPKEQSALAPLYPQSL